MNIISIIPATVADAGGIAEVHVSTWKVAYRNIIPEETLNKLSVSARTQDWIKWLSLDCQALIAIQQDIKGFISYGARTDPALKIPQMEITALYVLPKEWRKGIGHKLCSAVIHKFKTSGFEKIILWVIEANLPARQFYESIGFIPTGRKKTVSILNSVDLSEIEYQKKLI